MHWAESYVLSGKQFTDIYDCGEFVREVMQKQFNKLVPLPTDRFEGLKGPTKQIARLKDEIAYKVEKAKEGDAVVMISRGRLYHIGIYCEVNKLPFILHNVLASGPTLTKQENLPLIGIELEGFYRWK